MKTFEQALHSQEGIYQVSEDWLQGRTAFGGLVAAIGLQEIERVAQQHRVPLSLNIEFIAPVPPGNLASSVRVLRSGKYLDHIEAALCVNDSVAVSLQAVLGAPRSADFQRVPEMPALSADLNSAKSFSRLDKSFPPFLEHFDFRYTESGFPFSGTGTGTIGGFCKHQSTATGYPALVALLDAWPPTALPAYRRPIAASSVHWNIHFHHHEVQDLDFSRSHCEYKATTLAAENGMATTHATLCSQGEVLASARQLVAIFD